MPSNSITRRSYLGTSLSLSLAGTSGVLASETTSSAGRDGLSWKDNRVIQNDRHAALNVLKPSRQELEHGLKLHANSVVFDAYGFSPRLAVDGNALIAAMGAGASKIELEDMREDMYKTRCVTNLRVLGMDTRSMKRRKTGSRQSTAPIGKLLVLCQT